MPSFLHRSTSLKSQTTPSSTSQKPEIHVEDDKGRPSSPRPKSTLGFSSRIPLWKSSLSSLSSSNRHKSSSTLPITKSSIPNHNHSQKPPSNQYHTHKVISPDERSDKRAIQKQYSSPYKVPPTPIKKDSPRTMKIHHDWRIAAKNLKGLARESLEGAICVRIFDPLEGVHGKSSL